MKSESRMISEKWFIDYFIAAGAMAAYRGYDRSCPWIDDVSSVWNYGYDTYTKHSPEWIQKKLMGN